MKATIGLSATELRDILSAVAEYNGYNVTAVSFRAGGQDVSIDEVVLQTDDVSMSVRTKREENNDNMGRMSRMLAEVRASYGTPGHRGGSGSSGGGPGGTQSGDAAKGSQPVPTPAG